MEPERKRRKRGLLQRQEAARASVQEKSALHELLMTLLAQGLLSGALCHSIAVAAKKDMDKIKEDKELADLEQLAGLKLGKNLVRSVYGDLKKSSNLPVPFPAEIPYKDATKPGHILLPHEYFAAMYENEIHWKTSILGDSRKVEEFWTHFDKHPLMNGSPLKKIQNTPRNCFLCPYVATKFLCLAFAKSGPGVCCPLVGHRYWLTPLAPKVKIVQFTSGEFSKSLWLQIMAIFWAPCQHFFPSCDGAFKHF